MSSKDKERTTSKRLWSKQQDQLLLQIVADQSNPKWCYISQKFNQLAPLAGLPHLIRTNKQCRQRWQNHLNPALKNHLPWSDEEHCALFQLFRDHSHHWCELGMRLEAQGFEKRGENNIKNYFYSAVKRQIKRINEVIRQNNRETKKRKGQMHHYHQKYAYKQRLSLQRQILGRGAAEISANYVQGQREKIHMQTFQTLPGITASQQQLQSPSSPVLSFQQLHIVKQLDHELLSKILLIAEQKAGKKFVISNNHLQEYHREAEQLRDQLIELIIQRDQALDQQKVLQLAINMLNISRHCKRKNTRGVLNVQMTAQMREIDYKKMKNMEEEQQDVQQKIEEPDIKITVEPQRQGFNEQATIDKLMVEDKDKGGRAWAQFGKASQQYVNRNEQPFNPFNISLFSSYDYARQCLDRSSQFLQGSGCLSNISMLGCYEPLPTYQLHDCKPTVSTLPALPSLSFINSIREVKTKQHEFPSAFNPFLVSHFHQECPEPTPEANSLFTSQSFVSPPPIRKASSDLSDAAQMLNRSWAYSSDMFEPRSLLSSNAISNNMKEDWAFNLPKSNFQRFDH